VRSVDYPFYSIVSNLHNPPSPYQSESISNKSQIVGTTVTLVVLAVAIDYIYLVMMRNRSGVVPSKVVKPREVAAKKR